MSWNTVKFSDLFNFQKKSKIKAGDGLLDGKYKFFTSSEIQSKFLNDYLYNETSLIFGTGGKASIHFCNELFAVSTDCFVTTAKDCDVVNPAFVYHYLSGNIHLLERGFKGAGLKHISKDYLQELIIPLPPLPTQKRIADILEKADALRKKDKQVLRYYDDLAQSLFIDMFDPSVSNSTWETFTIEQLAKPAKGSMRTGPFGSDLLHSEFVDSGIFVLGIDNVVNNSFEWAKPRFITQEKYEKLKRYTVYPGDILISIMGTTGRCAIVPNNISKAINSKHLAAITLDTNLVCPEFVCFSIHSDPTVIRQLLIKNKGAIMDGLNLSVIKQIKIKLPPLELQKTFADSLKNIELQKNKLKAQKQESENLFQCLLQKAFNGGLN